MSAHQSLRCPSFIDTWGTTTPYIPSNTLHLWMRFIGLQNLRVHESILENCCIIISNISWPWTPALPYPRMAIRRGSC